MAFVLDNRLSPAAQEFNRQIYENATNLDEMIRTSPVIGWLAAIGGLLKFQSWAKVLYLASTVGTTLTSFLGQPSYVLPGSATGFYELATMAAGATLLLLYGTEFGRSWKTVRA